MSSFEPNKRHLRELLIYFFNLKKSATAAHRLLVEAYGEAALSERSCREWFQKFKNGKFDIEDKKRSGRPKVYEDAKLVALLDQDSCQTQEELASTLGVTQQAISHRLKSLGMIKNGLLIEGEQIHDIKTEVHSEDESLEDCTGQSSFDLASNKPDILQLVSGQSDTLIDDTIKCKEENIDDTQKVWMTADQEKQLASILDETKGWKKLAHRFNFEYLLNIFEQSSSSSTLLLLNYIAIQTNTSLSELRSILYEIGEEDAATYMAQVLSMKHET